MKILVAPNALKGSVSAMDAAERMTLGLKISGLKAVVDFMPIADGGDDTMDVLVAAGGEVREVEVLDPLGSRSFRNSVYSETAAQLLSRWPGPPD